MAGLRDHAFRLLEFDWSAGGRRKKPSVDQPATDYSLMSSTNTSEALKRREIEVMTAQINALLSAYTDLDRLPIQATNLVEACRDGVIPAYLIHALCPTQINVRRIHRTFDHPTKDLFWKLENWDIVIQAARKLGCRLVNVGGHDLLEGKEALLIGLLWQLVKQGMTASITGVDYGTQSQSHLPDSNAEARLMEWINIRLHLEGAECLSNLGEDLADGSVYARLLKLLSEVQGVQSEDLFLTIMAEDDFERRAELIVTHGRQLLGELCSLEPADIVTGNEHLNLIFVSSIIRAILQAEEQFGIAEEVVTPVLEAEEQFGSVEGVVVAPIIPIMQAEEHFESEEEVPTAPASPVEDLQSLLEEREREIEDLKSELTSLRLSLQSQPPADLMAATEQMSRECQRVAKLQHDSACLRAVYKAIDDPVQLAKVLYGEITWNHLWDGASLTGTLSKRGDMFRSNWSPRACILRDNFLFYWESENHRDGESAKSVIRLDDAKVELLDKPAAEGEVEAQIMIRVDSLSSRKREVFFGGRKAIVQEWFDMISRTISWFDQ